MFNDITADRPVRISQKLFYMLEIAIKLYIRYNFWKSFNIFSKNWFLPAKIKFSRAYHPTNKANRINKFNEIFFGSAICKMSEEVYWLKNFGNRTIFRRVMAIWGNPPLFTISCYFLKKAVIWWKMVEFECFIHQWASVTVLHQYMSKNLHLANFELWHILYWDILISRN